MLKFGEFISEGGYHVPVVSISKDQVDLSKEQTRNEINRNLSAELSRHFMNPYGGWMKIGKVLQMYSVTLPKVIFKDEMEGEEVVAIQQFGGAWGAKLNGQITDPGSPDESEYFLYYSYGISDSGFYETYAAVVDENELSDMLKGDNDVDVDDEYGDLDPRQKE